MGRKREESKTEKKERDMTIFNILICCNACNLVGAYLYYYHPGVAVNRNGGGIIIPLPPSVGQ